MFYEDVGPVGSFTKWTTPTQQMPGPNSLFIDNLGEEAMLQRVQSDVCGNGLGTFRAAPAVCFGVEAVSLLSNMLGLAKQTVAHRGALSE